MSSNNRLHEEAQENYLQIIESNPWWELTDFVTLQESLYWAAFRELSWIHKNIELEPDARFYCHDSSLFFKGMSYQYRIGRNHFSVDYKNMPHEPLFDFKDAKNVEKQQSLFEKGQEEWKKSIEEILSPYKALLFYKLASGELKAYGQDDPEITLENMLDDCRCASFTDSYDKNYLSGAQSSYFYIHFEPEVLVRFFPAPTWVSEIVETYNGRPIKKKKLEKRGRKRTGLWDEFHVEVAKYLLQHHALPKKQSELVQHCQNWFSDTFGEEPPESEIKEKVSLYYKKLST
jgi:hypothetical protein